MTFVGWMLRDKKTGRWHNWGELNEWLPADSPRGGTLHHDKNFAEKFAREYKGCEVEVVPFAITEMPAFEWPESYVYAKMAKYTGVMPNNAATEFTVFENGEEVRKVTKEEALRIFPEVRTFPI